MIISDWNIVRLAVPKAEQEPPTEMELRIAAEQLSEHANQSIDFRMRVAILATIVSKQGAEE